MTSGPLFIFDIVIKFRLFIASKSTYHKIYIIFRTILGHSKFLLSGLLNSWIISSLIIIQYFSFRKTYLFKYTSNTFFTFRNMSIIYSFFMIDICVCIPFLHLQQNIYIYYNKIFNVLFNYIIFKNSQLYYNYFIFMIHNYFFH